MRSSLCTIGVTLPLSAFLLAATLSCQSYNQRKTYNEVAEARATPEFGERYLDAVTRGTLRVLDDIERTFAAMPPR